MTVSVKVEKLGLVLVMVLAPVTVVIRQSSVSQAAIAHVHGLLHVQLFLSCSPHLNRSENLIFTDCPHQKRNHWSSGTFDPPAI